MIRRSRFLLFTLIIASLILVGGLYLDKSHTTIASNQPSTDINLGVEQSQEVVIKLYYDSQEQLNSVAGELDIWEVHSLPGIGPSAGYAVAAVYPAQQDWLEVQGFQVEIDQVKTALLQAPNAPLDPRYYYFDTDYINSMDRYMVEFVQEMSATYPSITQLLDIGDAWTATQGGYHRDIWALRISSEDPQYGSIDTKPPFIMMANIHAREVSTPEMAIRYIKYLTMGYNGEGGYGIDPDVTWLVNHHVVYVVVSINPDGHRVNEANTGAYRRKNVDNDDGCNTSSIWGVDLNRNNSFKWGCCGGSDGDPCGETYRGPTRASEPETQAIQNFATEIFGDWNGNNGDDEYPPAAPDNTQGIFLSLHSYQDEILWAYECHDPYDPNTCPVAPNSEELKTIGRKLADMTGEVMDPTGFLYTVDGGTIDFMYGKLGIPGYTYEIGPTYGTCGDFFPPYGCQDGIDGMPRNFWAEMGPSFIYFNKIAGSPYKTAYGPDTVDLQVTPTSVPAGIPVALSGTVADSRHLSDPLTPVAAAEYFIDVPGNDGAGIAMSPADGSWGSTSEGVLVEVDTTGLSAGQHYILVHGMSNLGYWGPFTAIFLTVTTPTYGVMLTPETDALQADPGTTVTYHLQATNFGQFVDTYDITVASGWIYDAPASIGPIAAGDSATFDVQVTIPSGATHGESDLATVTVESQAAPGTLDNSELTTTANFYDLTLTPPTDDGSANPGEQVYYVLHVTNTGNTADSFTLSSMNIWTVTLPPSVGPLDPGASSDVTVIVAVPTDAVPGDSDVATITATSAGNDSVTAFSTLTSSVTAVYSFQVAAVEDTLTGYGKGTTVDYTVLVTNTGNITDTYTIHISGGSWPVDAPVEVGPVSHSQSASVTITVHIPYDIVMGDSNDTNIVFISQGNSAGHQVTLHTNTFWLSNFLPLTQKQ